MFTAQDLVKKLLVVDPEKRLTTKQALDHSWLQVFTWAMGSLMYVQECFLTQCSLKKTVNSSHYFSATSGHCGNLLYVNMT